MQSMYMYLVSTSCIQVYYDSHTTFFWFVFYMVCLSLCFYFFSVSSYLRCVLCNHHIIGVCFFNPLLLSSLKNWRFSLIIFNVITYIFGFNLSSPCLLSICLSFLAFFWVINPFFFLLLTICTFTVLAMVTQEITTCILDLLRSKVNECFFQFLINERILGHFYFILLSSPVMYY